MMSTFELQPSMDVAPLSLKSMVAPSLWTFTVASMDWPRIVFEPSYVPLGLAPTPAGEDAEPGAGGVGAPAGGAPVKPPVATLT